MAILVPAISGKMGSINYYQATMKASELVAVVRPACESDDWSSGGIQERMQRELQMKRVLEEIVPYLERSPDRFTGAVIVLVRDAYLTFEPVVKFGAQVPAAYRAVAGRLGFLTLEGGKWVYLDGQHRGVAFRHIIQWSGNAPNRRDVADDDICVILVEFESIEKTRRIFNKVNRYARSTSRADNIITSEDDGYAIVARRLLDPGQPLNIRDKRSPDELIVDWKSNTITGRSTKLTTLSALYESAKVILKHHGVTHFDEKTRVLRPPDEELDEAYQYLKEWWIDLLEYIEAYRIALADNSSIPNLRRDNAATSLLFKPAGQQALIHGLGKILKQGGNREDMIRRVNGVNWATNAPEWTGTIVREGGRISARADDIELAGELIAYILAPKLMSAERKRELQLRYTRARNSEYVPGSSQGLEPLPEPVRK